MLDCSPILSARMIELAALPRRIVEREQESDT